MRGSRERKGRHECLPSTEIYCEHCIASVSVIAGAGVPPAWKYVFVFPDAVSVTKIVYSTSVVAAENTQYVLLRLQAFSTFSSTSMLSGPKNQKRPESGVYLIGTPAPLLFPSVVFQSIFTAKRLPLRQT